MILPNEYIQRGAEWLQDQWNDPASYERFRKLPPLQMATGFLEASGALSRIEALEKVLRYVLRTSQGVDFGHQVVVRSDGKEQTLAGWIAEVLDGAALSQAQQSDE